MKATFVIAKVAVLGGLSLALPLVGISQTVFVPSGTSGIGSSSNSNVGIGTSSPDEKLSVAGNLSLGGGYVALRDSVGGTAYALLQTVSNDFNVRVYGSGGWRDAVRIDGDSGRIGLNVSSPGQPLHVWGLNGLPNTSGTAVDGVARFGSSVTNLILDFGVSGGGDVVAWLQSRSQVAYSENYNLALNPNGGRVGVGTTSPRQLLEVSGNSNPSINIHDRSTAELTLGVAEGDSYAQFNTNSNGFRFITGQDGVAFPGTGTERLRITNAGNIGIGATSPDGRLNIAGAPNNWTANGWSKGLRLDGIHAIEFGGGSPVKYGIGQSDNALYFFDTTSEDNSAGANYRMVLRNGSLGIGTTSPSHRLTVNGSIRAKEVIVDTGWSDYVFDESYRLAPLSEVEQHIRDKKHLPGIPSAAEVEAGGVSLGEMQAKLLAKVEELTLHLIDQQKQLRVQQQEIVRLRAALSGISIQKSP